jgi:hypothetical protein
MSIINRAYRKFTDLLDTLTTYTGSGGKWLRVKTDETGIEAITITAATIGADASGAASGAVATHLGAFVHSDIALNTSARHSHLNKTTLDVITAAGSGSTFLSDDGTYKTVVSAPTYTNATLVPTAIGGIAQNTTFSNKTMTQMWDSLLYPYQVPAFNSFGITGVSTPVEVGTTISGSKTFTWGTTNPGNINTNSIMIQDITGSSTLGSSLLNDGTEVLAMGSVQKVTATSNTWRITGTNTQSANFIRDYAVSWQWMRYYGESALTSLAEANIKALRIPGLSAGLAATYSFAAGGYKYLSYPSVLGTATSFKDSGTNLDIPFEAVYTVSVTNANGIVTNYNVHRSTNVMGGAVGIIIS